MDNIGEYYRGTLLIRVEQLIWIAESGANFPIVMEQVLTISIESRTYE